LNQKRRRTNSFIFFFIGQKKGGEEVDELVNERNRQNVKEHSQDPPPSTLSRITRPADINTAEVKIIIYYIILIPLVSLARSLLPPPSISLSLHTCLSLSLCRIFVYTFLS